jgi:hypothetical protein
VKYRMDKKDRLLPQYKVQSPILFITFCRPNTTSIVFEQIRAAKPSKLYLAQNIPSIKSEKELESWNEVRRVIESVDWDCEVVKLYREKHLSAKDSISSAINWFFENESEGIIMEDDVEPSSDFFRFCDYSLNRYRADTRIGMITGNNLLGDRVSSSEYIYSQTFSIWGWATWRRAWKLYDPEMRSWPCRWQRDSLNYRFKKDLANYYSYTFDSYTDNNIDTWDIQWLHSCLFNNFLCIIPKANMISNIGIEGAHSSVEGPNHNKSYGTVPGLKFNAPKKIVPDPYYDERMTISIFKPALTVQKYSRLTKKLGIHGLAKAIYRKFYGKLSK